MDRSAPPLIPLGPALALPAEDEAAPSRLAAGWQFEGQVRLAGSLTLAGTLTGGLARQPGASARLHIAPEGQLHGTLSADALVVQGRAEGDLDLSGGSVALHPGATLTGRLRYGRLQVDDATLDAHVEPVRTPRAEHGRD